MNFQEIINQTVTYKGHTLKFIDFVQRFKTKKDVIDHDNGTYILSRRTKFYINVLNKHKNLKFFWSWNRGSIFAGLLSWLIYRKMFLLAMLFFGFHELPYRIINLSFNDERCIMYNFYFSSLLIITGIVFCFLTNYYYFCKIAKDILEGKPLLKHNTNLLVVFITVIIMVIWNYHTRPELNFFLKFLMIIVMLATAYISKYFNI